MSKKISVKDEEAIKKSLGKEGSPLDSETLIRHKRAEIIGELTTEHGYDRESLEELDLDELVAEQAHAESGLGRLDRETMAEQARKAFLGEEGNPLSSDTIVMHKRAEIIGELTSEHGYDRKDLDGKSLSELMNEHAKATMGTDAVSGADDPMNPGQGLAGEKPPTKTIEQRKADALEERLNDDPRTGGSQQSGTSPVPGSNQDPSAGGRFGGSDGLGGSATEFKDTLPSIGTTTGSTTGNAPGGNTPGGNTPPPTGSVSSEGATIATRDDDGNWRDQDGNLLDPEDAEAHEAAYQQSLDDSGEDAADAEAGADAEPPPDTDTDVEYTPSGDDAPRPGTPQFDRWQQMTGEHSAIRDWARANSNINPTREGVEQVTGDADVSDKSLTGPDGDTRLDGAATESAGGSAAGQGFGNSQGSGAITYGPDSDVNFGMGLEDEIPENIGREEDLSHLVGGITSEHDEAPARSGPLPAGISAEDMKVGGEWSSGVGEAKATVSPPLADQTGYMAVADNPMPTGGGGGADSGTEAEAQYPALDVFVDKSAVIDRAVAGSAETSNEIVTESPGKLPDVPTDGMYTIPKPPGGSIESEPITFAEEPDDSSQSVPVPPFEFAGKDAIKDTTLAQTVAPSDLVFDEPPTDEPPAEPVAQEPPISITPVAVQEDAVRPVTEPVEPIGIPSAHVDTTWTKGVVDVTVDDSDDGDDAAE